MLSQEGSDVVAPEITLFNYNYMLDLYGVCSTPRELNLTWRTEAKYSTPYWTLLIYDRGYNCLVLVGNLLRPRWWGLQHQISVFLFLCNPLSLKWNVEIDVILVYGLVLRTSGTTDSELWCGRRREQAVSVSLSQDRRDLCGSIIVVKVFCSSQQDLVLPERRSELIHWKVEIRKSA